LLVESKRKSYQQFCGLARALDHLGERWTLLIVRDLLLGPRRYSDLLEGLPGITTNLLAARLRELSRTGLVLKRQAPPPVRAQVYELSPSGRALEAAIMELARWGSRYMSQPDPRDRMNIGWGLLSVKRRYVGGLRLRAELRIGARTFELAFEPAYLSVSERAASRPDVVLSGSLDAFRAWLFGGRAAAELRTKGALAVEGSERAFAELASAFAPRDRRAEDVSERPLLAEPAAQGSG
jgi:DNA-binding HxlR family transcriptional regulator